MSVSLADRVKRAPWIPWAEPVQITVLEGQSEKIRYACRCCIAAHGVSAADIVRIDHDVRALCSHGESSVGPVTIRSGRVSGSRTPHVTGCKP